MCLFGRFKEKFDGVFVSQEVVLLVLFGVILLPSDKEYALGRSKETLQL
jgi:hypothetical protein